MSYLNSDCNYSFVIKYKPLHRDQAAYWTGVGAWSSNLCLVRTLCVGLDGWPVSWLVYSLTLGISPPQMHRKVGQRTLLDRLEYAQCQKFLYKFAMFSLKSPCFFLSVKLIVCKQYYNLQKAIIYFFRRPFCTAVRQQRYTFRNGNLLKVLNFYCQIDKLKKQVILVSWYKDSFFLVFFQNSSNSSIVSVDATTMKELI